MLLIIFILGALGQAGSVATNELPVSNESSFMILIISF